jgi:hypothetical protein
LSTPNPVPTPTGGASLSDLLTALRNLVIAVNNASTTYANIAGIANFGPITSATVIKNSAGRICEIAIISAGTTTGYVYDSASTGTTTATMIPLPNIVGVYKVSWPMAVGLLVIPGTGQTISGSYS